MKFSISAFSSMRLGVGVGVNLRPFSKRFISFSLRSLFDKFIILGSMCFSWSLVVSTVLGLERGCRIFSLKKDLCLDVCYF